MESISLYSAQLRILVQKVFQKNVFLSAALRLEHIYSFPYYDTQHNLHTDLVTSTTIRHPIATQGALYLVRHVIKLCEIP